MTGPGTPAGSAAELALIVESIQDYAIFALDPDGRVMTWNRGAERMKQYAAAEIIGRHFSCFYTDEDRAAGKPERELETAEREGRVEDEGWRVRKDGSRFWANVIITVLRDASGVLRGFGKVTRDLTESLEREGVERRLAASEAVARSERWLKTTLRSIGDAVIATDPSGRIELMNHVAEQLTGWREAEARGQRLDQVFHIVNEHSRAPVESPVDRVLREGMIVGLANHTILLTKAGGATAIDDSGAPIRGESGELLGVVLVFRDITERRRNEAEVARAHDEAVAIQSRLTFLAEASALLSSSLDYEQTLRSLARLVVPRLADWCAVEIAEGESGASRNLTVAHVDPAKVAMADELNRRYPPDPSARQGVPEVIRSGRSELYPLIPDEMLTAAARDEEHLRLIRELGIRSAMVVPVSTGERVVGAITLVTAESDRRYSQLDLALAEELGRRAGLAVENARLYREARRAEERTARLQLVTAALSRALSPDDMGHIVLDETLALVDGSSALLAVCDEGRASVSVVAVRHVDPAIVEQLRDTPLSTRMPYTDAIREGAIVWCATPAESDARYPQLREMRGSRGVAAWGAVPISFGGQAIGAIAFGVRHEQQLKETDREYLLALAGLCGQALERARLYQTAERANRVKDDFLATLSHELRTPLNAILGWAHLLRTGKLAGEAASERALETIERNARLQAELINDVLDVSRIVSGKLLVELRQVNLVEVVNAAVDAIRPSADSRGLLLSSAAISPVISVLGDSARLQQVIANLLTNAVKFTPQGGRIEVNIDRVNSRARVRVTDSGVGISPDFLPHMFERFRQADSSARRTHGGLGIGLSIVRYLIEQHGGSVEAHSGGEGQGATFTVKLPIRAVAMPGAGVTPAAAGALPSLRDLRVLVVDDEADARELIGSVLAANGAEVRLAGSAAEALDLLGRWEPDLLVSDIGMPTMDGHDFIRQVRTLSGRTRWLPAIALTAYASMEDRERALLAGYQMHVPKPVDPDALVEVAAQLARWRRR